MNYFADFDRHVVAQHVEAIRREVQTLRLENQLRESGGPRPDVRLTSLFPKS